MLPDAWHEAKVLRSIDESSKEPIDRSMALNVASALQGIPVSFKLIGEFDPGSD